MKDRKHLRLDHFKKAKKKGSQTLFPKAKKERSTVPQMKLPVHMEKHIQSSIGKKNVDKRK